MRYGLFVLIVGLFLHTLAALPTPSLMRTDQQIVVNNRILTTVNGKTISVLDVMKEMDVFLSQYYPDYMASSTARLQFYTTQWRSTLQRMVDQELMMADAESRQVKTTDGEVREEIQNRYGPNVMGALDKLGISPEEAKKMVHRELVVQKIQWLRVTSKALAKVTTDFVRKAYDEHLQKNPPKELWTYQFVTFRYETIEEAMPLAEQIMQLYESSSGSLSVAAELFKQKLPENEWNHFIISSELQTEDRELSISHREVLTKLSLNSWSDPIIQESRDGTKVIRVFHLKSHTTQEAPAFETLAARLKQDLLNQYADTEMEVYLPRLYQRFGFDPKSLDIPAQFEPFSF